MLSHGTHNHNAGPIYCIEQEDLRTLHHLVFSSGCQTDAIGRILSISTNEEIRSENLSVWTHITQQVGGGLGLTP